MTADTNRITILSTEEIAALYDLPHFDAAERQLYFTLSDAERRVVDRVHTTNAAVHLVLQLGYFKAKRRFFVLEPGQIEADVAYVMAQYFTSATESVVKPLTKPTRLEQQRLILQLFHYRICGPSEKEALAAKARRTAMLSTQPAFILRELLQHMEGERLVAPGYSTLQDIVGQAVIFERRRITGLLDQAITPEITEALNSLLTAGEFIYRISAVKQEARDFSYGEMKREVERRQMFQPLHDFAKTFLANSGLSVESGKYYALLVK
jgi:hypothetical protein